MKQDEPRPHFKNCASLLLTYMGSSVDPIRFYNPCNCADIYKRLMVDREALEFLKQHPEYAASTEAVA
jgi:hypothetical protein